jgi:penicillin-binding protein 2
MENYRSYVRIFIGLILVVMAGLGLRLAQLQLLEYDEYAGISQGSSVRQTRVLPARGVFYDRSGEVLVANAPSFMISLTPAYFDAANVGLLAGLLGVADSTVGAKLEKARAWSAFRPSPAFRDVPEAAVARLSEQLYRLPGVQIEVDQQRAYPAIARAAHAFGYIREITGSELDTLRAAGYRAGDLIGKTGLEKQYERYLRGRPGHTFQFVSSRGTVLSPYHDGTEDFPPESGYDLYLSLNADVQALAESLFVNKRGGAVALDPQTGEILALVSKPDFDPAIFTGEVSPEQWAYLTMSEARPMFNRATMMGLPPGSTWKPFMALVGLQEGVITPTSIYYDRGGYRLGGRLFSNYAGHAYGPLNVTEALRLSSNAFFFNVMMGLDVDTFKQWATRFGFGVEVPTDLPEQSAGLIPDSAYYNRVYPKGWTAGYTINLGIGQGDMVVTPLQLARYVAAVGNGGTLVTPHLVRRLVHPATGEAVRPKLPDPEQIPIEDRYFDVVREGMRRVMEAGTGRFVQLPGIPSGGKTGTAQNPHGEDHSIFILFAPWDDPQIAVAVMVENAGYGASAAGPIASLMAEQYLTGTIAETPQRKAVLQRALNARSKIAQE